MRHNADWMTLADERILEFLEARGNQQPMTIAKEFTFHRKYIGKRCRKLQEYDFLIKWGRGVYHITERGEQYLAGEFDARVLNEKKPIPEELQDDSSRASSASSES